MDEKVLDEAVIRLYIAKLKLGMIGDDSNNPYKDISYDQVDSKEHAEFNLNVARKSLVLLKNDNNLLPLNKEKIKSIGIIGPNANNRKALVGNYEGTASRYYTIAEGIQDYLGEDVRVHFSEGCHLYKEQISGLGELNDRISEVKGVCEASDVIIACMGLDSGLEGEEGDQGNQFASGDKPDLNLSGIQQDVLETIYKSGKPVVLLLLSGSALAVTWADQHIPAILQGWYPGAQGGKAIASVLFGDYAGGETIQVYVKCNKDNTPNPQLKYLKKLFLQSGESQTVHIELDTKVFGLYNEEGKFMLYKGEYELFIGTNQPDERSVKLTGNKPYVIKLNATNQVEIPQ